MPGHGADGQPAALLPDPLELGDAAEVDQVGGLRQALLEGVVYDEGGQLLTGSYMDYTMPRASNVPSFEVVTSAGTVCTSNSLGVKGCGEAGAIGSPPAVINAITNAIGVRVEMPATPEKVWRAIQGTKLAQAAE
jgi:carbon-monoxide dehydrogenase large subunit